MDVNVPLRLGTVDRSETEPANATGGAMGRDALLPRHRVALVGVDGDLADRALE